MVGTFYVKGLAVHQSYREAIKWYLDATTCSDAQAAARAEYLLGKALEEGLGVNQNLQGAEEFYQKAAAHGEHLAIQALQRMGSAEGFLIRACCPEDAVELAQINRLAMGYDYPVEATQKRLCQLLQSGSDRFFCAIADGRVVGYIHISDYNTLYADHMKNIMGLAVLEDYRRRGIGTALLHAAEQWAKEDGAAAVRLVSGEDRLDAHKLYERAGYLPVKRQMNYRKVL